jgi:hypothetical protein
VRPRPPAPLSRASAPDSNSSRRARRYVRSATPAEAHNSSLDTPRTTPSGSASAAVAASSSRAGPRARTRQDSLEQLGVDLRLPPRAIRRERKRDGARPPAARRHFLDDEQATPDKLIPVVQIAAAAQTGARRRRRRARPRATIAAGEAR